MTRVAPGPMPATLPEDVGALQALLRAAWAERDGLVAERDALAEQNDRLRHLLLRLKRLQFGARSERLPDAQLQLGLESLETAIAQGEAERERGVTPACARGARPSAGPAAARCRHTCPGSR